MAKKTAEIYGSLGDYDRIETNSEETSKLERLEDALSGRMTAKDMIATFFSIFKGKWELECVAYDEGYLVFKFKDTYYGDKIDIYYADAHVEMYLK